MSAPELTDTGPDTTAVSGRVFIAIPEAIEKMSGSFTGFSQELLRDIGLREPQADDWFPQATLIELLNHLQERVGPQLVERVGRFLPELLSWSGRVNGLADALQAVGDWYRAWNRGDEDAVQFTPMDDGQGALLLSTPYPAQFERGLVRGLVYRFGSAAVQVRTRVYEAKTTDTSVYRL